MRQWTIYRNANLAARNRKPLLTRWERARRGSASTAKLAHVLPRLHSQHFCSVPCSRSRTVGTAAQRCNSSCRPHDAARCARRCCDGDGRIQRVVVVVAARVPAGGRRVVKQARAESRRRRREGYRRSSGATPCFVLLLFCPDVCRREAQSRCRCGRGEPSLGADSAGAGPVPLRMWQGRGQSWCR